MQPSHRQRMRLIWRAVRLRRLARPQAAGKGVAVVDGRIVENLHIVTAKATLAKADAIAAMEA